MKLNEFFVHTENGFEQDKNYEPDNDISVLDKDDTRKTRLTLRDINQMRLAVSYTHLTLPTILLV